ncbi:MAG TPA: FtsX-like permease family protein [Myxococcaceae bacterium]|nr:FtsX-like permease family protein [Myxococcaceae bacterium]
MGSLSVIARIAFRNLFTKFLNVVVGLLILLGTLLLVLGGGLVNSIDQAMSRSIVGSVAGHLQIYSDRSKDELALFGEIGGSDADLAPIADFAPVKAAIEGLDNVAAVVPMGMREALITSGNTIDLALERLRNEVRGALEGDRSAARTARVESHKAHVRQMVSVLQADMRKAQQAMVLEQEDKEGLEALARAASPEFWTGFDRDPLAGLEFLENKIAPLAIDADLLFFRYMGTDPAAFQRAFDRMELVDGGSIPQGRRGVLLPKFYYEDQMKLKTARRLDVIAEALRSRGKSLAQDPELKRLVKMNQTQVNEILLQLGPIETADATGRLQKFLNSSEKNLGVLLAQLFTTDDVNFQARYAFFYSNLAPMLEMYRVRIGDTLTVKSFARSGYVESVNVKVYGTYQFKGLEKAALAGSMALMDLVTFRDLYGFVNEARREELKALQAGAGLRAVARENAEAELFGGGELVSEGTAGRIDEAAEFESGKRERLARDPQGQTYNPEELERGVVVNAAIILKDPSRLAETTREVQRVSTERGLGLRAVGWQKAAGVIGQFLFVAKAVLYLAVAIIFAVGLVIINTSMTMATLQRVQEIGTMRAIGAHRSFVLTLVLTETLMLGLVFGTAGALLGAGIIELWGSRGIPAPTEELYFFFSGPRLFPSISVGSVVAAFAIVLGVSALSTFYPALLATRVSPLEAMQTAE